MVSIEELYGIGQRSAGWEVLDRPSRFVDLRWAQVEGRRTIALLERQHSARFCLVLLSPAKYPASCFGQIGKMLGYYRPSRETFAQSNTPEFRFAIAYLVYADAARQVSYCRLPFPWIR